MAASAEETAALLGRVPVFEALRPEDLARVADVAVPRSFRGGEVVFRENDDSDTCYVVRSGHARAVREHADGRQITLATFGPGDIFGELAMFDDERRSAYGAAGVRRARARYRWSRVVADTDAVYRQVLAHRRPVEVAR